MNSETKGKRKGRPREYGPDTEMWSIWLRVPTGTREQIERAAEALGVPVKRFIAEAALQRSEYVLGEHRPD